MKITLTFLVSFSSCQKKVDIFNVSKFCGTKHVELGLSYHLEPIVVMAEFYFCLVGNDVMNKMAINTLYIHKDGLAQLQVFSLNCDPNILKSTSMEFDRPGERIPEKDCWQGLTFDNLSGSHFQSLETVGNSNECIPVIDALNCVVIGSWKSNVIVRKDGEW